MPKCQSSNGYGIFASLVETVHVISNVLQNYCISIVVLKQIQEWIVMIVIITNQKGRSVEELTFNHYAERITEKIDKNDKITFRRKEKRLKTLFQIINYFITPLFFVTFAIDIFMYDTVDHYLFLRIIKDAIIACFLLIFIISFSIVYRLLNKLHKLEFEKNSKQLKGFFTVFLIMASEVAYVEIHGSPDSHVFNYAADLSSLIDYCRSKSTFDVVYNWVHVTASST